MLVALAVVLFALGVFLARGWRREALRACGFGFLFAGAAVLVARSVAGDAVVDALATTDAVRPAAEAVWTIGTSLLVQVATATVIYGVVIVFAAWLAGPTAWAVGARRGLAPVLREPRFAWGGYGVIVLVLIAWAPTPAFRILIPALVLIGLLAAGVHTLRRQTMREFPDADYHEYRRAAAQLGCRPDPPRGLAGTRRHAPGPARTARPDARQRAAGHLRVRGREGPDPGRSAATDRTMTSTQPVERRGRWTRASRRYLLVLALVLAVFLFTAFAPEERWASGVLLVIVSATLAVALWTSFAETRRVRELVVLLGIVVAVVQLVTDGGASTAVANALSGLFVVAIVVAIVRGLASAGEINRQSVLGAISVYLLVGMLFTFAFSVVAVAGSGEFFAEGGDGTRSIRQYFSFATLTTVGYGDYTAAGDLGRTLANLESLFGQLYLVTVVGILVSRMSVRREGTTTRKG